MQILEYLGEKLEHFSNEAPLCLLQLNCLSNMP